MLTLEGVVRVTGRHLLGVILLLQLRMLIVPPLQVLLLNQVGQVQILL
jgi:hypothetical protein